MMEIFNQSVKSFHSLMAAMTHSARYVGNRITNLWHHITYSKLSTPSHVTAIFTLTICSPAVCTYTWQCDIYMLHYAITSGDRMKLVVNKQRMLGVYMYVHVHIYIYICSDTNVPENMS